MSCKAARGRWGRRGRTERAALTPLVVRYDKTPLHPPPGSRVSFFLALLCPLIRPMRRLLALLPLLLVAVASCSDSAPFVPNIDTTNFAPSLNVNLAASTKTASGLYYRDITVGAGALVPVASGASVTTTYAGYLRNGTEFDSGNLPAFTTGTGAVIDGYDEGVRGMRVGGQRQLIIPPSLGYGSRASGSIPANSILIFVITLTATN